MQPFIVVCPLQWKHSARLRKWSTPNLKVCARKPPYTVLARGRDGFTQVKQGKA